MGRTLPSITQVFQMEEQALSRFRRALRKADQAALDALFNSAQRHLAAAAYAAHLTPLEIFLLAMLLEEHKEGQRSKERLDAQEEYLEALKEWQSAMEVRLCVLEKRLKALEAREQP